MSLHISPSQIEGVRENALSRFLGRFFSNDRTVCLDKIYLAHCDDAFYTSISMNDPAVKLGRVSPHEGQMCVVNNFGQMVRYTSSGQNTAERNDAAKQIYNAMLNSGNKESEVFEGGRFNHNDNNFTQKEPMEVTGMKVILPFKGWVLNDLRWSSRPGTGRNYGASRSGGRRHNGVDFADPYKDRPYPGTPVYAVADGTVTNIIYDFYDGTSAIEVQIDSRTRVLYGEVSRASANRVRMGQKVKMGEHIADTGHVMGGGMHFEVYYGNFASRYSTSTDPIEWFAKNGAK